MAESTTLSKRTYLYWTYFVTYHKRRQEEEKFFLYIYDFCKNKNNVGQC